MVKHNYFLGILLALIFPGFIQYYIGEKAKGNRYIILYFSSFLILFIFLVATGKIIDVGNAKEISENSVLIQLSFIINVIFRLTSGIDGLLQIRRYHLNHK